MTTIDAAIEACGDFTPAALRQVGLKRVPAHIEGQLFNDRIRDHLPWLGLGVWHDGAQQWLIGNTDETLHPHERWLYMQVDPDAAWTEINHHGGEHQLLDSLAEELASGYAAMVLSRHRPAASRLNPSHYMRSTFFKPNTQQEISIVLDSAISPLDMHDLAFHYETYVARTPEAATMPRELVWRMHGLHDAAKTAQMNRAARMQGLWNDDAFLHEGETRPVWEARR